MLHQSLGPCVCLSLFLADSLESKAGCVIQGILASFLLSLSHRRLWTTRFWSIKGPQQLSQKFPQSCFLINSSSVGSMLPPVLPIVVFQLSYPLYIFLYLFMFPHVGLLFLISYLFQCIYLANLKFLAQLF